MSKASLLARCLAIAAGVVAVVAAAALPARAETTLRAIAFIPKNHPLMSQTVVWVDEINKALEGKLKINYVGGPEVIPGLQQVEALGKGVIDVVFNPTAYYQSAFPEAGAFILSRKTPTEEREPGGFYDYMVERHKRLNARYIGRALWANFYWWTKDKPASLEDFKGMKLRTTALHDRFMREMGVVPVTIPEADTYTGLERGTVDGFAWPLLGPRDRGWTKIAKYVVDLPYYGANNIVILMNLDKWNALPQDVRDAIEKITAEFEPRMVAHFKGLEEAEWKNLREAGVEAVKLSPEENEKFVETAYEVEWTNLQTRVADIIDDLRRVSGAK